MEKFKCKLCKKVFNNYDSLRRHMSKVHKVRSEDFYVKFYLNGIRPTCKCGCREFTRFTGHGFCDYKVGHIARIRNNWGHNPKANKKSAETRRRRFKSGEISVWNKGLDVSDPRIWKYGRYISKILNSNPEELRKRSERAKDMWRTGKFKVKYGKESANWRGGKSSLNACCHASEKLYKEWKFPILKKYEFKCTVCGSNKELNIHHNEEKMSEVIKEIKLTYNLDKDKDKNKIIELVINYHINNNVSGIVLCKKCHRKLHNNYNF